MTWQPAPRGNRKTVIIGFDFGTHSTKVVFRVRGRPEGRIAKFDTPAPGYPVLASPSLVRYLNGQLFFGTQALRQSGGQLFRSLKVRLLLNGQQKEESYPAGLDARSLATAYFAWAFQQLKTSLRDVIDGSLSLNVAAPMGVFEVSDLKTKYLQIIQAAWNVSFADQPIPINQGISAAKVAAIFTPLLKETILGPEHRRFGVLPETIAPVVSLSLDPLMKPGIYTIVDTGAGTTEMSVFHAGWPGADQKVLCYQDETILLGGNDLHAAARLSDSLKRDAEVNRITGILEKRYRQIWQRGYHVDSAIELSKDRWKDLTLVLSGGGTRHAAVKRRLSGADPVPKWPGYKSSFNVCRHVPGTLEIRNGTGNDEGSMFAVANGLAIERAKWPVYFEPNEIEPLVATQKIDEKPERYFWSEERRPRWV